MTAGQHREDSTALFEELPERKQRDVLRLLRRLAGRGKDKNMANAELEDIMHNTQEDLADDLWETAQWCGNEETAKLLEFAAERTRKGIFAAWKNKAWEAGLGWNSKYAWLAFFARVIYIKAYADGYAGAGVGLNPEAAVEQVLADDDFWEYYFEAEVTPGAAVKMLLKELERLKDFDK